MVAATGARFYFLAHERRRTESKMKFRVESMGALGREPRSVTESEPGEIRAARLPPDQHREVLAKMGIQTEKEAIHWEGASKVFPLISPTEARAILERIEGQPRPTRPGSR
jgi:hypothetical protein